MRTRKRVALLLGIVAVACVGYFTVQRVHYTRARFNPQAYDDAIGVLKRQFGEKAVEQGIVRIPKTEIHIPVKGEAVIGSGNLEPGALYINLTRESAALIYGNVQQRRFEYAEVSPEEGQRIWAFFAYLDRLEADLDGSGRYARPGTLTHMAGTNWHGAHFDMREYDYHRYTEDQMIRVYNFGRLANCGGIERIRWRKDIVFSTAAESSLPAFRQLVDFCTENNIIGNDWMLQMFLPPYARLGGKEDLERLGRLDELSHGWTYPWYCDLPLVGKQLKDAWERRQGLMASPTSVAGEIWAIENVKGKPDKEREDTLCKAAFPAAKGHVSGLITAEARRIIAEERPAEWQQLILDHYGQLDDEEKAALLDEEEPTRGGEPFLRKLARDESSDVQGPALARLYDMTHEAQCISALEQVFQSELTRRPERAGEAVRALVGEYAKNPSIGDVESFIRGEFGARKYDLNANAESSGAVIKQMLYGIRDAGGGFGPLVADLLNDPDKLIDTSRFKASVMKDIAIDAVCALSKRDGEAGIGALVKKMEVSYSADDNATVGWCVRALETIGDMSAVPALKSILAQTQARETHLQQTKVVESAMRNARPIGRAIVAIELRNAPDREQFSMGLSPAERTLIPAGALADSFSREDMKRFLASDSWKEARTSVCSALVVQRARENRRLER